MTTTGFRPRPNQAKLWSYQCMAHCPGEMKKLYKAFYDVNVPVDVIPADADLSGYKIILLPQLIITKPESRSKVEAFVRSGGTLVLTYRSAVKDADNNIPFGEAVPVGYTGLAGVTVTETESLQDLNAFPIEGQGVFAGSRGFGGIFRDMLKARDAEVLYRYADTFYTESAAVTRRKQGAGSVYYYGCALDEDTTAKLIGTILADSRIETTPSGEGVEVVIRGSAEQKVRMLMNHNDHEVYFQNKTLSPFGCAVETL